MPGTPTPLPSASKEYQEDGSIAEAANDEEQKELG
jgi:hypothetical protein